MTNTEQLFIRACKSKNPHQRLKSVYRRFYLHDCEDPAIYIANILIELSEKYYPIPVGKVVSELSPCYDYMYEDQEFQHRLLSIFTSWFRLSKDGAVPGVRKPIKWRR